ncbi:DUF7576 family protein [Haladaptatus sp. NG-SE-30]
MIAIRRVPNLSHKQSRVCEVQRVLHIYCRRVAVETLAGRLAHGNDDRETPPSASNNQRDTLGKTCDHCGTSIDTSDWHPITKDREADGSIQIHHFCSEDCENAWQDE